MSDRWAWFRKWWYVINIVYGVALVLGIWIVNGSLHGNVPSPFVVLIGVLFLSLGLDGISAGDIGNAPSLHRDKNPIPYWLSVLMSLLLGCVLFIGGIHSLWRGG